MLLGPRENSKEIQSQGAYCWLACKRKYSTHRDTHILSAQCWLVCNRKYSTHTSTLGFWQHVKRLQDPAQIRTKHTAGHDSAHSALCSHACLPRKGCLCLCLNTDFWQLDQKQCHLLCGAELTMKPRADAVSPLMLLRLPGLGHVEGGFSVPPCPAAASK